MKFLVELVIVVGWVYCASALEDLIWGTLIWLLIVVPVLLVAAHFGLFAGMS